MRTFWVVLKNNYFRTIPRFGEVFAMISLTLAALFLGVYLTNAQKTMGHVAILAPESSRQVAETSKHLRVTFVEVRPPLSDLVKQKFAAIAEYDRDGNLPLETLYNEEKANLIRQALLSPGLDLSNYQGGRSVGENIVGFTLLFMLMFSV